MPNVSRRLRAWFGLSAFLCVASFCLYNTLVGLASLFITSSYAPPAIQARPIPVTNKIAFISDDGQVWLSKPNGEDQYPITSTPSDYQSLTWSHDGRYLSFVSPEGLHASTTRTPDPQVIFRANPDQPFYTYWTPQSAVLSFLTRDNAGFALRQINVERPQLTRLVDRGSPFYLAWSPQGDRLFIHAGPRRQGDSAHLSLLDNPPLQTPTSGARIQLNLTPGQFQTPAWSADGRQLFYVAEDNGQDRLYQTDVETLAQTTLTDLSTDSATLLVVSSDGRHLAYLETDPTRPVPIGQAYLMDIAEKTRTLLTKRAIIAMYWSPDGQKLALLSVSGDEDEPDTAQQQTRKTIPDFDQGGKGGGLAAPAPQSDLVFRWWVYDIDTETLTAMTRVEPTISFLQTIPFFDQHHLSATYWSPDSRYFVITNENSVTQKNEVVVLDTTGVAPPQQIGYGALAVWSWK